MLTRPVRNWDWLTGILVFLLLQVSAARLVTTEWASRLYFAETLAGLGTILGLAIGASRFGRTAAIWLTLAYTIVVVPWQISSSSMQKLLLDRMREVGAILLVALGQFMAREPVKNPLFFVAVVCLAFWLLAVAAGYWAARHRNILVSIIPSGIALIVIQIYANYQPNSSWWLAVYTLVALLLVGRIYFLKSEANWSVARIYVSDEAWPNIMGGLFTALAAAVLVAWIFPTSISSVQAATDTWARVTRGMRDRLSNAVTSLNGPNGKPGTNFYGGSLALGQDAAQGDATVFTVDVLKRPDSYLRYYWRGRVYDTYRSGQWTTSTSSTLDFDPENGDIDVVDVEDRSVAQLRFTFQFPAQTLIYSPAEPVWLDRTAKVQVTSVQSGRDDVLSLEAKRNIPRGGQYQVRSRMGNPTVEQLRSAQTIYPKWVQDRYFQVPDALRPQFEALAQRVTAGQTTPYDKAAAITSYLRANLSYSTTLPSPPEGRDPVQWVLFSYKKGFCNYYASAEVLMLRSVGVPARLAVGFAQGEFQSGAYTVRRRDAHAWPEVFFPGFGWTEFEPTVSQQALARTDPGAVANNGPAGRARRPLEEDVPPEPQAGTGAKNPVRPVALDNSSTGRALLVLYLTFILGWVVYLLYRYRAFRFLSPVMIRAYQISGLSTPTWIENWILWGQLHPVERAFASINWSLRWLGSPAPVHATPSERAAALTRLLPSAADDIRAVTAELHTGLFTLGAVDVRRARRAGAQVLLHTLRARVGKLIGIP